MISNMVRYACIGILLFVNCFCSTAFGQGVAVGPDGKSASQPLSVPYAFHNEKFGAAVGYVYGLVGYPQKQSSLLATVMAGSRGSAMGFLIGRDIQMPRVERLFLDPVVSVGYFGESESFIDGNPKYPNERAGSNDSDENNFWQQIDGDDVESDLKTNGTEVSFYWDNRDFFANPSKGNSLRLKYSRDFGLFDSSDSWTTLDGELDVYIPLGVSKRFRQKVLAFDVWTSYSPTWDVQDNGDTDNRPPAYTGATLGGIWKMRGWAFDSGPKGSLPVSMPLYPTRVHRSR